MLTPGYTQVGRFALNYLVPGLDVNHDAFLMAAIRKDVTRNLGRLQPNMIEDMRYGIDIAMGLDGTYWKEMCITKAMEDVVFKSTSRILVGSTLCQSEEYLHYSANFAKWLGGAMILVGQYVPWILKPFFGSLGALPVYYYRQKALKFLLPVVRERLDNIKRKRADPSFEFEEPKDLMTWMAEAVLDHPETRNSPPEFLGTRLLFLVRTTHVTYRSNSGKVASLLYLITEANSLNQTLGAIHTTIMTATNTMLDLISSDPDSMFWEQLREEAGGVFKTADDWTNPSSLSKLPLADSTIRESLRKNPMLTRSMLREVVARDGVILPSGHHIPKGTWMAASTVGLHHDERFYPNPEDYDPFRFASKQEDMPIKANKGTMTDKASIYRQNQALATTSNTFLGFSYGKHAWCVALLIGPICCN